MTDENSGDGDAKAVFLGASSKASTMADGTLRLQIDVSPADAIGAFTAFGAPGSPVALARITNAAATEEGRPKGVEKPYGQQAQILFRSSFFRNPDVWEAVGTDDQYLEWVKRQPSARTGNFSEYHDTGEQYCVPAHYRKVSEGSGTAIKPPYCAIPLTNAEHQAQHQKGYDEIGTEEWWQQQRIRYVHRWAWETAKNQIQEANPDIDCSSFGAIPPRLTSRWAIELGIDRLLPSGYFGVPDGENAESTAESEA